MIRVNDTLDTYTFSDSSKHLSIDGTVDVFNGLMDYKYSYRSTYSIASYKYKQGLFKRSELRLKVISDDPNNNIKAQTFTVSPPRDLFSVGVGLGASAVYDDGQIKVRPSIHVGFYKSIYTFKSKK